MTYDFPNDENGKVLRSLISQGDTLTKPREIEFHFLFPTRSQAIGFIEVISDKAIRLELSWYAERVVWQITVVKHMLPTHDAITELENRLIDLCQSLDGIPDGWGCFEISGRMKSS